MTRRLPLWKRIACSLLLTVFAFSALAGTICTGHQAPHPAAQTGRWIGPVAQHHAVGHSHTHHHQHHHHGEGAGNSEAPPASDAACDPPVYLSSSSAVFATAAAAQDGVFDMPLLVDSPRAYTGFEPPKAAWSRVRDGRPPPREDPFSITARLRL